MPELSAPQLGDEHYRRSGKKLFGIESAERLDRTLPGSRGQTWAVIFRVSGIELFPYAKAEPYRQQIWGRGGFRDLFLSKPESGDP